MKKLALWLCKISGAENELRNKHFREVGAHIISAHYWFNGGTDGKRKIDVLNTLWLIGEQLKENAWFDVSTVRRKVYKMDKPYLEIDPDEIKGL